ncbi:MULTISPECIES: PspA/IM30 family protein [unclassified Paenibacillus]|uniref:PspA/IM30 family protein n=1 Tax=unclassified Paenibacillus TaxID=185978 RepID=UPI002F4033D9
MGIFDRIFRIGKANVNSALDKMEDPVKMIDQILRELDEDVAKVTTAVTSQIAVEKRFERELNEAKEAVAKRDSQARQALSMGNEDLAREALGDKKRHEEKVAKLQVSYDGAKQSSDRLRTQLQEMKDRVQEMKSQRGTLIAQAEAAKAQERINQTMSGVGTDDAAASFAKMEEKILKMRDQAEAAQSLAEGNRDLDNKLEQMMRTTRDTEIDDELAALKAELNEKKNG